MEHSWHADDAVAAFAHELRTPLTSIHMAIALARESDGTLALEAELAGLLRASLDALDGMADGLQEWSRLRRGKVRPGAGPVALPRALELARAGAPGLALSTDVPAVAVACDSEQLGRALAWLLAAVDRGGDGSGEVSVRPAEAGEGACGLVVRSGRPGGAARAIDSTCGFAFFCSLELLAAMRVAASWERAEGYFAVSLVLPLA